MELLVSTERINIMARQLKRWESPRSQGRNHKGRGGSARHRQRKKQFQRLRITLKNGININSGKGVQSLPALVWRGLANPDPVDASVLL